MDFLVNELTQGKELAEQLREQLKLITSPEEKQFLVEKILNSYEKALSLLNWEDKNTIHPGLESPLLSNCSPSSDLVEQEFVDNSPKNVYKKRKTEPRWTEQVKVCLGNGLEGPLDDGYSWRKYGQKDILGANFPRGYFRCTHRHSQGCLARKQVQRSDNDPSTFEVTYRGRHTCFPSSPPPPPVINEKSKPNKDTFHQFEEKPNPIVLKQLSFNFRDGIKIQEFEPVDDIFPSFSFPDANNNIFMMETNLLGSFSPELESPAISPTGEWDISIDFTDFEANFPLEKPESYD